VVSRRVTSDRATSWLKGVLDRRHKNVRRGPRHQEHAHRLGTASQGARITSQLCSGFRMWLRQSNNQTTPRGALPLELPALAVSRVAGRNTSLPPAGEVSEFWSVKELRRAEAARP